MPNGRTDDLDRRVREVEQGLAKVREGLAAVRQQVQDHEGDIRAFAPLVVAEVEMRGALTGVQRRLEQLTERMEIEARERAEGQRKRLEHSQARNEERKREMQMAEERRTREAKELAELRRKERIRNVVGVTTAFITSVGVIIAAILAGPH